MNSTSVVRLVMAVAFAVQLAVAPAAVRYVNVDNASPNPPYASWSTAATNIQDAIDTAVAGDEVQVTNGVYQTGGRAVYGIMTNRVVVDKAVTVRSVNGPAVTEIRGYPGYPASGDRAVRCVYLTNGAVLAGFILTQGATRSSFFANLEREGGGVFCESTSAVLSNCVLTANTAAVARRIRARSTAACSPGILPEREAAPNRPISIPANLMNWEWLGTAQATAPGVFEFFDSSATTFARRFYRAGTP